MQSRRTFIGSGLAAVAWGLASRRVGAAPPAEAHGVPCAPAGALGLDGTSPVLRLEGQAGSIMVDGLPFDPWFTGDDWGNDSIPFHFIPDYFNGGPPPEPQERTDVVVIGGGISGLATALMLRPHRPIVLEMRRRFGGQAMGERWHDLAYPMGSAYFITPDRGSFLDRFYRRLGLHQVRRESFPPDPLELNGVIREDLWSGAGLPAEEQEAFARYSAVVRYYAEEAYPEIPLPDDPHAAARVIALDALTFRQDLEQRMGMALTPILAAAVQSYFYSSFGAGMDDISAAAGWNFVAAEEFGRWVLPGGNSYLVWAMWKELCKLERLVPPGCRPHFMRAGCGVVDIRPRGANVQVSYVDSAGSLRSIETRQCVVALPKHIARHALFDLAARDPARYSATQQVLTLPYVVVNILLDAPIPRDFYDCFLLGDGLGFPMNETQAQETWLATDILRGDYAQVEEGNTRSVLTLFWPLPWHTARFSLIYPDAFAVYAARAAPQVRHVLSLLNMPESAVRQVRMTRWGHAMPVARPGFIAQGTADILRAPLGGNIHFVNQDNFALPAVENSLLEARRVAREIDELL